MDNINFKVIEIACKKYMAEEYGISENSVRVEHYANFDGSKEVLMVVEYLNNFLKRSVSISQVIFGNIRDNDLHEMIFHNLTNGFDDLKIIKNIGNDKQKAILNSRNESNIVREHCKKILYNKKESV